MSGLHDPAGLHLAKLRWAHVRCDTVLRRANCEDERDGDRNTCDCKLHAHVHSLSFGLLCTKIPRDQLRASHVPNP